MLSVAFDFSDWEAQAKSIEGAVDQLPFAMALALNRSADVTRQFLIQSTWPQHVQQRNASFIAASLTTKDSRASKQSLAVEIYDKLDRGNLQMHAKGGQRVPRGGSSLAVPSSTIAKTSRGVPAALRPKAIPQDVAVRKGDVLYARNKRTHRLRLLYVLKHATKVPQAVPFYQDFAMSMQRELQRTMPMAVAKALATRKR
jgi:hypothetical protein